jgi:hypothetical protein
VSYGLHYLAEYCWLVADKPNEHGVVRKLVPDDIDKTKHDIPSKLFNFVSILTVNSKITINTNNYQNT